MAGDWIKLEAATLDKPEVMQFARLMGISKAEGLELLIRFWLWADLNCVDGFVDGLVDADVDKLMHQPGFTGALSAVGWLKFDRNPDRMTIPNFHFHLSASAKKRSEKNRIQAKWRAGREVDVDTNVDVNVDQTRSTKVSTREEKRREEKYIPENFTASDKVRAWATKNGHTHLDRHLENFVSSCQAKGYKYVDWDAAFRRAITDNWAKIPKAVPLRVSL